MPGSFDMAILSRLRFKQLALVASLADTLNLHASARKLGLSQPGATKLLREVERALDVSLFERSSKGMIPTVFGDAVARHARQILFETARLKSQVEAIQRGELGTVRLGAIMEAVPEVLARTFASLQESSQGPLVTLTVSTSDHLIAALNEGLLDIALGRPVEHLDMGGIRFEPLWLEELTIVASPDHPATRAGDLGLEGLRRFDWVLQPKPSPMRTSIELAFARIGLPMPANRLETASMLMTAIMVSRTNSLAVLPSSVAQFYVQNGLVGAVPVALSGHLGRYGLLVPIKEEPDPAVEALAHEIRRVAGG